MPSLATKSDLDIHAETLRVAQLIPRGHLRLGQNENNPHAGTAANALMVRKRTGDPAKGRNCLGMADFMRDPLPPATIMASLDTESIETDAVDIEKRVYAQNTGLIMTKFITMPMTATPSI